MTGRATRRRDILIAMTMAGLAWPAAASADDAKPLAGVTLTVASQNDQFAAVLVKLAPEFLAQTGIKVNVDILSYPELLTKITADFIGRTKSYDVVTTDIVWSGQFAEAGYTVDLTDWIKRDATEIQAEDIYPVLLASLGGWKGKQVAFPFAGYANVLAYRTDLYAKAGLPAPVTMEDMVSAAQKLTDRAAGSYGFVANGQKGPAVAQDWMQYNNEMGGAILTPDGAPSLNSAANIASLGVYKKLFETSAPPGAVDYDWGGREESFRQGIVANMQTWSVGAAAYGNPEQSKVVGKFAIALAPHGRDVPASYGIGGWGLGINAAIDPKQQEAAWRYIKWVTSAPVQKEMALAGAGGVLRISTTHDPELLKRFPFYTVIDETFVYGNGDFRPRIPQYPEIQDLLGSAVNAVLVGNADPKSALDAAQAKAAKLF